MSASPDLPFFPYDDATDREHVHRIWREVGWLDPDNPKAGEMMDSYVGAGKAIVAKIDGEAESGGTNRCPLWKQP